LVKFFLTNFLHICSFCFNISYIESLSYIPNKIHTQKCMYIKAQTINQSIFFNFKSLLLYIWCIYVANFFYRCFLLQVEVLKSSQKVRNYCFNAMLITCKCMPFCKKLDYNTKNEPPYLATTLLQSLARFHQQHTWFRFQFSYLKNQLPNLVPRKIRTKQ
jgi:hypothetical protein